MTALPNLIIGLTTGKLLYRYAHVNPLSILSRNWDNCNGSVCHVKMRRKKRDIPALFVAAKPSEYDQEMPRSQTETNPGHQEE